MKKPASSKRIVPLPSSTKLITCVPCEYHDMKIRFWPGTWWKTWAVHSEACGWVRTGTRKIAFLPSGVLR